MIQKERIAQRKTNTQYSPFRRLLLISQEEVWDILEDSE
jgi:hypothetical protein